MKPVIKSIGVALAVSAPIFFAAVYVICCSNAGHALTWDQFSEGLLVHTSNCGGNSAAAYYCQEIAVTALAASEDSGDTFDFKHLPKNYHDQSDHVDRFWTPDAKYLLNTGPIRTGSGTHTIVVVCDTPYGNVPQPSIWNLHRRTLRHAASYSDSSIGWLTPAEFAALNKSNFFELKYIPQPPQSGTNSNPFE